MSQKILSITLNPALDISGVISKLTANEKIYVRDEMRSAGGNGINAARIIDRLKVPVIASGFLGGSIGKEISTLLHDEKIPQCFVDIHEQTRINVNVSSLKDHRQTRLSFPGPMISGSEKKVLIKFVEKNADSKFMIVGGSLPRGFSVADLDMLIRFAQNHDIRVVVDCPGGVLKKLRSRDLLLLKPNLEEFQEMTGTQARTISQVKAQAKKLLKRASYICISSVEGGALLITDSRSYFGKIPRTRIQSSVGAGDSMVGAMVAQIFFGNKSVEDILRWGLAAAASTLCQRSTTLGSAKKIRIFYKKIHIRSV